MMLRVTLFLSFALLATGFIPAKPPSEKGKTDRELIEGTWEAISTKEDGKPIESANVVRITLSKGKVKGTRDGEPAGKGTYKIDPSKNPKWIDVTINDVTFLGIYEFVDDDTLRMCHSKPNSKLRPKAFVSESEGPNRILAVSKRVKQDDTDE